MPNKFDTRVKGQPLKIFASEYNNFIEAAKDFNGRKNNQSVPGANTNTHGGVVFVKNVSGQDVSQYNYLVIEKFLFNPIDTTNQGRADDAFKAQVSFNVNVYDDGNEKHIGAPIAILLEPIRAGGVGRALLDGSSQMRVNITNIKHTCFTRISGQTILESSTGGDVESIMMQEKTGEGWAYGTVLRGQITKQFKVIELKQDYVNCHEYVNGVEGTVTVKLALPYMLRRTPFDGTPARNELTYVYSENNKRVAKNADDEEEPQIIIYNFIEGDIVEASRCIQTDVVDENDDPVVWFLENRDSRFWMEDDSDEEEEV